MPGLPFPVRVPVAHNDRPPAGHEAELFTYAPASEWNEHWVGVDLVEARKLRDRALDLFRHLPGLLTPLGP